MDNTTFQVNNTNQQISLNPGNLNIWKQDANSKSDNLITGLQLTQNPVNDLIQILTPSTLSGKVDWKIYNTAGIEIAFGSTAIQQNILQIAAPEKRGNYFVVLRHANSNALGLIKVLRQ